MTGAGGAAATGAGAGSSSWRVMPKAANFSSSDRRRVSGRGDGVLPLAHGAQLVLRHLRQVLDLRHAGRPGHRLLRRGRNEFRLRRFVRFVAGLDRLGEGGEQARRRPPG